MIKVLWMGLILAALPMSTIQAKSTIPKPNDRLRSYGEASFSKLPIGEELHLLVWNIFKGGKPSFGEDYRDLGRDVDFLMLQEMISKPRILEQTILYPEEYEYHFAVSFYTGRAKHATGVGTHSHYRANYVMPLLAAGREIIIRTPKAALFTKYLDQLDRELLLVNVHSLNFVSTNNWQNQLVQIAKEIQKHTGPVIFAGDFNTWNDKRLNILHDITQILGMTPVFKSYKHEGRMHFLGRPLDHIFYRDIHYLHHEVMTEVDGSDHKAILLKFHL